MKRTYLIILLFLSLGCQTSITEMAAPIAKRDDAPPPAIESVREQVTEALRLAFARRLNTREHGAWQIVHGCIPFRDEFLIEHEGHTLPALKFLLTGGEVTGWELEPGVKLASLQGRRGWRSPVRPGSSTAQGHADQWLGYLASCRLPAETPIVIQKETFTLAEGLAQMEYDVPHNVENEYSWTLMALAAYRPHNYSWTASDGREWNVARIVEIELEQDVFDSACGGAHRMVGLAMAYQRWRREQGERTGIWEKLEQRLNDTVADVKAFQHPDGTLSSDSFLRPFKSADLGQEIAAGGHVLEFLAVQLTDEQLREPWVTRAVLSQCRLLRAANHHNLHCGALYHAASALRLYHERMFGDIHFNTEHTTKPSS
jgi:hypothetical protein